MNSRDRVLTTLAHREPDHVPLDIGGSDVTGIHRDAYRRLARFLGLPEEVHLYHRVQQLALPSEQMLQKLKVDIRPLSPHPSDDWKLEMRDSGTHRLFTDEWGVEWAMPNGRGLYFDMVGHPLSQVSGAAEVANRKWPDGVNEARFRGLRQQAEILAADGLTITLAPAYGGVLESAAWQRHEAWSVRLEPVHGPLLSGAMHPQVKVLCLEPGQLLTKVGKAPPVATLDEVILQVAKGVLHLSFPAGFSDPAGDRLDAVVAA